MIAFTCGVQLMPLWSTRRISLSDNCNGKPNGSIFYNNSFVGFILSAKLYIALNPCHSNRNIKPFLASACGSFIDKKQYYHILQPILRNHNKLSTGHWRLPSCQVVDVLALNGAEEGGIVKRNDQQAGGNVSMPPLCCLGKDLRLSRAVRYYGHCCSWQSPCNATAAIRLNPTVIPKAWIRAEVFVARHSRSIMCQLSVAWGYALWCR